MQSAASAPASARCARRRDDDHKRQGPRRLERRDPEDCGQPQFYRTALHLVRRSDGAPLGGDLPEVRRVAALRRAVAAWRFARRFIV